ncbi:MAG: hypothetical protein KKE44_24035 [Proteobacteria bacterium]|nr:hypothetical protein [Pseudomonadota bacterium]MBU1585802.1 hypothetical protein [Pseudomonadota bacterium]MBU2453060.1 hypothetical protein [Pseudomonadota bacterium]MBU2630838.1 hypothetical protein [Pseudomonadota bacterium]
MTYYSDLSSYEYIKSKAKSNILNIGWLDKDHQFNKGNIDSFLLKKIFNLCRNAVNKTRGYHLCPFCNDPSFGVTVEINDEKIVLGSAEIWVKGENDKIYSAPDLIYHYINEHSYLPPKEFLTAIKRG